MNALKNGSRFSLLPVEQFAQEMNRFFEGHPVSNGLLNQGFSSPVSIWETDTHYFVELDLPGITADDVELKVVDNHLMIRADRSTSQELTSEEGKILRQERRFGRLERSFQLPSKINESEVEASLTNGVLRVSLAKAPESQVKRIEIKTA